MRKRKYGALPRMILDREMCLRVTDGDEEVALPTSVYHCPICCKQADTFSGKLRYQGREIPQCADHEPPIQMVTA